MCKLQRKFNWKTIYVIKRTTFKLEKLINRQKRKEAKILVSVKIMNECMQKFSKKIKQIKHMPPSIISNIHRNLLKKHVIAQKMFQISI